MLSVWIAETQTQAHALLRSTVLSEGERARCRAMKRQELSEQVIVAHALKRLCLAERLGEADPQSLSFTTLALGKPKLASAPIDFDFNLSHCADACALVISAHGSCGVDVEPRRALTSLPSLLERSMSPAEQRAIARCADAYHAFIDRWVLKEAYSKMTGRGLGEHFERICTESEMRWLTPDSGRLRDAFIWRRDLGSHVVAVCSKHRPSEGARTVVARVSDARFRGLTAHRYEFSGFPHSEFPHNACTRALEQMT